jgi:hypothetical protein
VATSGAQPGNKNAAKGKRVREAILRAIARGGGTVDEGLDKACDRLVGMMKEGTSADDFKWAFEQIANRLDGKPPQAVNLSGEDGGPVQFQRIEIVAVTPEVKS